MHLFFKKKYYQHVRNAVLAVCAKPVPVWGKRGETRGLLRGKNYLDMSSKIHRFFFFSVNRISSSSLLNCKLVENIPFSFCLAQCWYDLWILLQ